jgi:hypothetical protein
LSRNWGRGAGAHPHSYDSPNPTAVSYGDYLLSVKILVYSAFYSKGVCQIPDVDNKIEKNALFFIFSEIFVFRSETRVTGIPSDRNGQFSGADLTDGLVEEAKHLAFSESAKLPGECDVAPSLFFKGLAKLPSSDPSGQKGS